MAVKGEDTGISIIDTVPWGSHLCVLYGNNDDLLNTLVPFFKAGLQNNEFCTYVDSSEQFNVKEALKNGGSIFAQSLETSQMVVVPLSGVYLEDGVFSPHKALNYLTTTVNQALQKGYKGVRIAGNIPRTEKVEWENLTAFEAEANTVINEETIIALCAYPFERCSVSEFTDVIKNHQYVFIIHEGEWLSLKKNTSRETNKQLTSGTSEVLTPLQTRFAITGLKGFEDSEIIELFLNFCSLGSHQLQAINLIKTFKNIRGFISASTEQLQQAGVDDYCIARIGLLREIPAKVLEERITEKTVYKSTQDIIDYLDYSMRDLTKEVLKVIHLDARNQIMEIINLFEGNSDNIAFSLREAIEMAIERKSKSLIFVHNHPSGDPTPSLADKQLTRDLVFVSAILQIRILDHIIIGKDTNYSFAGEGLIREYEKDFLNLKLSGTSEAQRRLSEARDIHIKRDNQTNQ